MSPDDNQQPTYAARRIDRASLKAALEEFGSSDRVVRLDTKQETWSPIEEHVRDRYDAVSNTVRGYHAKVTELVASGKYTDTGLAESVELRNLQNAGAGEVTKARAMIDRELQKVEETRGRIERGELVRGPDGNFQEVKPLAARLEASTPAQLHRIQRMQEAFDRLDQAAQLETIRKELLNGPHSELLTAVEMEIPLVHQLSARVREWIAAGRLEVAGWQETYRTRVFAYGGLNRQLDRAAAALGLVEVKPERTYNP
jgi:hypothetical protein